MNSISRDPPIEMTRTFDKSKCLLPVTIAHVTLTVLSLFTLWKNPLLLAVIFTALASIEMWVIGNNKAVVIALLCSCGFAGAEIACIHMGAWSYTVTSFFDFPLWIIPGYGNISLLAMAFYELATRCTQR